MAYDVESRQLRLLTTRLIAAAACNDDSQHHDQLECQFH